MSSGDSMLMSDNFSLLQASIVTIAEPSLPLLLISSPQRLTAWWCRFICILFRVWLLHLRSMCGALSDSPHKGQVAGPVMWLIDVYCIHPAFKNCSCSLKVTFGTDKNLLLSWAWARGCIRLLRVRVGLCCALRRVMQFLPKLVEQWICVSLTKVLVGVHMMF